MWTTAAVPQSGQMTGSTPSAGGDEAQRQTVSPSRTKQWLRPLIGGVIGAVLATGGMAEGRLEDRIGLLQR